MTTVLQEAVGLYPAPDDRASIGSSRVAWRFGHSKWAAAKIRSKRSRRGVAGACGRFMGIHGVARAGVWLARRVASAGMARDCGPRLLRQPFQRGGLSAAFDPVFSPCVVNSSKKNSRERAGRVGRSANSGVAAARMKHVHDLNAIALHAIDDDVVRQQDHFPHVRHATFAVYVGMVG